MNNEGEVAKLDRIRWGLLDAAWRGESFDCPGLTLADKNDAHQFLVLREFIRKSEAHEPGSYTITQKGIDILRNTMPPKDLQKKQFCPAPWHKSKAPIVVVACPDCGELPALSVQHKMDLSVQTEVEPDGNVNYCQTVIICDHQWHTNPSIQGKGCPECGSDTSVNEALSASTEPDVEAEKVDAALVEAAKTVRFHKLDMREHWLDVLTSIKAGTCRDHLVHGGTIGALRRRELVVLPMGSKMKLTRIGEAAVTFFTPAFKKHKASRMRAEYLFDESKEMVHLTLTTKEGKEIDTGLILPRGYKVNIVDAKDGRVELVPEKKRVRFTEARFDDLLKRLVKKYAPVAPSDEQADLDWLVELVAEQRKLLRDARVGFEAMEQGVHFSGLEKATLDLIKQALEEWSNG
jgi:ssDNA-binding Zn-finger/Zn-ribbon topoisomerase 1